MKGRFGVDPVSSIPRAQMAAYGADQLLLQRPTNAEDCPQRPLPAPPNNRAVGLAVVKRFGVPERKSEVSYLSRFHLLNAQVVVG
jgi:hypothetical protein